MSVQIVTSTEQFIFNDGDVEEVNIEVSSDLDFDPMPMDTANNALVYDLNGVKKMINIRGRLSNTGVTVVTGGSVISLDEQRQWLEKLLNGDQRGVNFYSNYSSTYNGSTFIPTPCYVSRISWGEVTGEPQSLKFEIAFVIGGF